MAVAVRLRVNGSNHRLRLDPRTSLLDLLRENLGLKRPVAGAWKTKPREAAE